MIRSVLGALGIHVPSASQTSTSSALVSTTVTPPRPEAVAAVRDAVARDVAAVRAGLPTIGAHLDAGRLDEALAAVLAAERGFAAVRPLQPPADGLQEGRAELTPLAAQTRSRIAARDVPAAALAHAQAEPGDVIAYDATLLGDLDALRAIEAPWRDERAIRESTRAIERRRRSIRRNVQRATRELAERQARALLCGDTPPVVGGWDGELVGSEAYMRRSAHDPDSVDVENCTAPVLTRNFCWVSRCQVRGKNAFGAMVLNTMAFSVGRAGILGAERAD